MFARTRANSLGDIREFTKKKRGENSEGKNILNLKQQEIEEYIELLTQKFTQEGQITINCGKH